MTLSSDRTQNGNTAGLFKQILISIQFSIFKITSTLMSLYSDKDYIPEIMSLYSTKKDFKTHKINRLSCNI